MTSNCCRVVLRSFLMDLNLFGRLFKTRFFVMSDQHGVRSSAEHADTAKKLQDLSPYDQGNAAWVSIGIWSQVHAEMYNLSRLSDFKNGNNMGNSVETMLGILAVTSKIDPRSLPATVFLHDPKHYSCCQWEVTIRHPQGITETDECTCIRALGTDLSLLLEFLTIFYYPSFCW